MGSLADWILFIPGILAALTVHEYSHGWAAYRLGDPTAKLMGRLTLNPLPHLDPIGTILLFLVHFGWAKPVPVDPRHFDNPRRDMVWVALAGPGANVMLAALGGAALQFTLNYGLLLPFGALYRMLGFMIFINLMLAFFNLVPIPPLDGSKVVEGFLPLRYLPSWERFGRVGWLVLIGIIILGRLTGISIFGVTILPISALLFGLFTGGAPMYF